MLDAATAKVLPITGYLNRLSTRPGGSLEVKVSAQGDGDYSADVVRIVSGDPNPAGRGLDYREVSFPLEGKYPARHQPIDRGSYASVPASPVFAADRLLSAHGLSRGC